MKKLFLSIAVGCIAGAAAASPLFEDDGNDKYVSPYFNYLPPTYLDDVYVDEGWGSNWFISAQGGFSAFLGTPSGCGDVFNRTKPLLNVSIGKWLNPKIGGRLSFQGLSLMDAEGKSRDYQNYHADFLYNASSHFRGDMEALPKWDCIPYAGVGFISNSYTENKHFAFSYGIIGRYRMATRWHVSAELGMTTTFQDFDGLGKRNRVGDHLLQASIGLTATLGKLGWKRVIDSMPYIYQNDQMLNFILSEEKEKRRVQSVHEEKAPIAGNDTSRNAYPRNNYSGLNALRQRLQYRNQGMADVSGNEEGMIEPSMMQVDKDTLGFVVRYLKSIQESENHTGKPIFFYFHLNSTQLVPESQTINVAEIANMIKEHDLSATIVGAADSKTGRSELNKELGLKRANFISELLRQHGVEKERITLQNAGGIDLYRPFTANRNVKLTIYQK